MVLFIRGSLIQGPLYLKGYRGSEMKRLVRRMAFQGDYLKENFPVEYHKVRKRNLLPYKRLNHKRHHATFGVERVTSDFHDIITNTDYVSD